MRRKAAARPAAVLAAVVTAGLVTGVPPAAAAPAACAAPADHEIAEVQGGGGASPLAGRTVRVEGVVTADFQRPDQLRGFFVQDPTPDDDPRTSDGIFVYSTRDVAVRDRVLVTGKVVEYHGLTELSPVSAVDVCGTGRRIAPDNVRLPLEDGATLERFEGVLLRFRNTFTATETYDLGRYGSVTVSADGRLFQPTDGRQDSTPAENEARRLLVDDASNVQNPDTVPYTDGRAVRLGDVTAGLTGVLSYGYDSYRLQPTRSPHFARANPRPKKPMPVGGDVRVASFNALNWFTTLDERGADTAAERDRQLAKLVAALKGLDADVVGLMEVQNNDDTAVKALVDALNAAQSDEQHGDRTYTWVRHPYPGTDAIKVAFIYDETKVRPDGEPRSSRDAVFDRPPLAQTFRPAAGGAAFTAIVNHFKSKGCGGAEGPDRDQGDGQGCYNARRVQQAAGIAEMAADVVNPLVLGDLNAYAAEDPIDVLADAGLTGQAARFVDDEDRYSYVYFGQSGQLDYMLADRALSRRVTGATIWHINSDEPRVLDYNTEYNPPRLYEPNAFRSSDHDPLLVGLDLR